RGCSTVSPGSTVGSPPPVRRGRRRVLFHLFHALCFTVSYRCAEAVLSPAGPGLPKRRTEACPREGTIAAIQNARRRIDRAGVAARPEWLMDRPRLSMRF